MLKISKQADYGIQLLVALSKTKKGEYLNLRAFSRESTISFPFLQKIAKGLREAGLIIAAKGAYGGYQIARPMEAISLQDVIEALEKPIGIAACFRGEACAKIDHCTSRPILKRMNAVLVKQLSETKISDFSN